MPPRTRLDSLWTSTFVLLCGAQLLGYAQHALLTPAFPLYVTQLGGSPFVVGLVLGSFAVTSVIFRPLIGHWVDRWNAVAVMTSGLLFLGASLAFCFLPVIGAVMLANGLRGIGWAGLNTGGYTVLASTAPEGRRGEASGYYSGVQSSATILFPAVSLWLIDAPFGGFNVVFAAGVAVALVGAAIGRLLERHIPVSASRPQPADSGAWWRELFNFFDRDVALPSALLFCLNFSLPAVTSFVVLYARTIGIEHLGVYFAASGATSLLARPLLGRASDTIGRARSIAAGFILQIAALCLLISVSSLSGVIVSGVLYMLGNAIGSSTTLALAVERANPQRRGKAMATFSVAYPLSNGVGSFLSGTAVEITGYVGMYLVVVALATAGLVFGLANNSRLK